MVKRRENDVNASLNQSRFPKSVIAKKIAMLIRTIILSPLGSRTILNVKTECSPKIGSRQIRAKVNRKATGDWHVLKSINDIREGFI